MKHKHKNKIASEIKKIKLTPDLHKNPLIDMGIAQHDSFDLKPAIQEFYGECIFVKSKVTSKELDISGNKPIFKLIVYSNEDEEMKYTCCVFINKSDFESFPQNTKDFFYDERYGDCGFYGKIRFQANLRTCSNCQHGVAAILRNPLKFKIAQGLMVLENFDYKNKGGQLIRGNRQTN